MTSDLDKPNPARMYDYYLGGHHNFAADREAAERIIAVYPETPLAARTNRAFLRRAVTFLATQGIDQFLDIGSGIPTAGNVHEVAHLVNPDAHVVYVDIDPVAVAYGQSLLQDIPHVVAIEGDACHPDEILAHSEVQRLIDLKRPVGVLLVAVLHFVTNDSQAQRIVQRLYHAIPPGSHIIFSHVTDENLSPEIRAKSEAIYARSTNPIKLRSREQIAQFFAVFDLIEPGVVFGPLWRPDGTDHLFLDQPEQSRFLAGVGRK